MKIQLYDTTLRDGTQGEGISFSCDDKLRITRRLDEFGIDYIEGGWPGSNPKDMEFFTRAYSELSLKHARLTAFGSTCRAGIDPENDPQIQLLIQANTPVITIFGKSWNLHVEKILRTTHAENIRMISSSVYYLQTHGRQVIYDAEHFFDGYKSDPYYALATLRAATDAGADTIVLCDTNGGALPWEVSGIVKAVCEALSSHNEERTVTIGIHAHNDSELAVANSLVAVQAGCTHLQGTVNGYGERCGNANLISLIPDLQLKMGLRVVAKEQLQELLNVSRFVSELANLPPYLHQPFVGPSAFTHKGGTHVNAVAKHSASYQHIDPNVVGNKTRVLVSELSGKDNILVKSKEFGLENFSQKDAREVLRYIKLEENAGVAFEGADASVKLLLLRRLATYMPFFALIEYTVSVEYRDGRGSFCEATVKIRVKDNISHEVAEGSGPVDALNNALLKAILPCYPQISQLHLTDYKVRVLNSENGFAAPVRVLIDFTDGETVWSTVSASRNLIEASWVALADGVEYFLLTLDQSTNTPAVAPVIFI